MVPLATRAPPACAPARRTSHVACSNRRGAVGTVSTKPRLMLLRAVAAQTVQARAGGAGTVAVTFTINKKVRARGAGTAGRRPVVGSRHPLPQPRRLQRPLWGGTAMPWLPARQSSPCSIHPGRGGALLPISALCRAACSVQRSGLAWGSDWHQGPTRAPPAALPRPQLNFGQQMVLVGDAEALGAWELERAPVLTWSEGDDWRVTLDLPAGSQLEYKFAVTSPHE